MYVATSFHLWSPEFQQPFSTWVLLRLTVRLFMLRSSSLRQTSGMRASGVMRSTLTSRDTIPVLSGKMATRTLWGVMPIVWSMCSFPTIASFEMHCLQSQAWHPP